MVRGADRAPRRVPTGLQLRAHQEHRARVDGTRANIRRRAAERRSSSSLEHTLAAPTATAVAATLLAVKPVSAHTSCLSPAGPRHRRPGRRPGRGAPPTRRVKFWHRWLCRLATGALARDGAPLGAGLEAADLRARPARWSPRPPAACPESIGGPRNWDYRYTWLRDAAFTLYACSRIGFTEEAGQLHAMAGGALPRGGRRRPQLQIMYGIDGERELTEDDADHLEGYRGSRPVRIGNGAYDQLQLDIYGELMDAVYLYNKYGTPDLVGPLAPPAAPARLGVRQLAASRTRASGKPAADGSTSSTPSSCAGWRSIGRMRIAGKRGLPGDRHRWLRRAGRRSTWTS